MIRFKRWICLLLALSMVLTMVPITAYAETYSGTCGENLTWVLDEAGILTISGSGPMTDYSSSSKIPWYSNRSQIAEVVIGDGVTTIGSRAFYYCKKLTGVTIPDTVIDIGDYAFYYCSSLETVTIGDGVTRIGDSAFYECSSLNDLVIGDSVDVIGDNAFRGCVSLTSVKIPDSVTTVGKSAFYSCTGLSGLEIPGSLNYIGDSAFYGCTGLTNVAFGDGVVRLGDSAFYGCSGLRGLTIPDSVTEIGASAFYGCTGLTDVTIGAGVTAIENSVFYGCNGLAEVTIPDSVIDIGISAFQGCSSLTVLTIPDSVTTIGESAFQGCSSLVDVTIPDGVTLIGESAFQSCSSLANVTIPDSVIGIGDSAFRSCDSLTEVTIPDSVTEIGTYAFYDCSSLTEVTIPDSVTDIGSYAFGYCSGLTSAVIGDGAVSIPDYAFYHCTALTNIEIGESVGSIGEYAFLLCRSLPAVMIPNGVVSIGDQAFDRCSNLAKVIIPASVVDMGSRVFDDCVLLTSAGPIGSGCVIEFGWTEQIPVNAFSDCDKLSSLTIPDGIIGIGDNAFSNCKMLTNVSIPDGVTDIGKKAFEYCTVLSNVDLPDSVMYIGDYAFSNCSKLTGVNIPDSMINIEESTFASCTSLTSVIIPDTVISIGKSAFNECSSLTSVTIGSSVGMIGEYAFYGCHSLSDLTIPGSVTGIGQYAFSDCDKITSVTIPDNVTELGAYAFYGCSGLTDLIIGNGITTITREAFSNCSNLSSVTIGNGVTTISYRAFIHCNNLTEITIPDNVTSLGSEVFRYCYGLNSVTIGDGISTIPGKAFAGCSGMTSIKLGTSVESIGADAFYGCSSLSSAVLPDSVTTIGNNAFYNCADLTSMRIGANVKSIGTYAFAGCTGLTTAGPIGSGCAIEYGWVEAIPKYAFSYCSGLTSFTVADGITSIGDNAFLSCSNLINVSIPGSVTSIGSRAFESCTALRSVVIPEGVSFIDDSVFLNCTNLQKVTIPASVMTMDGDVFEGCELLTCAGPIGSGCAIEFAWVESIPAEAFNECSGLTSVVIPDGITHIGNYAFSCCISLTDVKLPSSISVIGDGVFSGCVGLVDIKIPEGVVSLGKDVFSGCTGLCSVTIPDTVVSIGMEAFQHCTSLTSVSLSNSITQIDRRMFSSCTSLTEVDIPDSVTDIGAEAFYTCKSLSSVTIGNGVTAIGTSCFENCDALTNVIIPDSVVSLGSYTFSGCDNLSSAVIGNGVNTIGYTFSGCPKLTEVIIGDNVTLIGSYTFSNCSSLTSVDIPASVARIENYAFSGCSGLTDVTFKGDAPDHIGDYAFKNVTATIFYSTDNDTWTDDVKKNYGGTITWVEYDPHALAENEHVLYFRNWDGDNQIAYFAINATDDEVHDIAIQVTDVSDSSFIDELVKLVDTYVLAQIQTAEGGADHDGILLAITPLATRVGTITAIGEYAIYIDDVAYPISDILYPLAFSVGDLVFFHIYNDGIVGLRAYDGSLPAPELPAVPEPEYRLGLRPEGEILYVEIGKTLDIVCELYYGDEQLIQWAKPEESISQADGVVTAAGWRKQKDGSYVLTLNGVSLGGAEIVISEKTGGTAAKVRVEVVPPTGNGTQEYPYHIASESDFAAIAQAPDAYYIVDADFEITQPYNIVFSGHFNGNYHTITLSGEMTLGLFLINSGTIEKVNVYRPASLVETFLDTDIIQWGVGAAAGSVASYNSGTITDCTVSGYQSVTVVDNKTNYYVGAIAGYNKGTISRCCSDLDIFMYVEAANVYVGGIVGANFGLIADSMNSGWIDPSIDTMDAITSGLHYAKFYVGGIAGESGGTIEHCIQASTVEAAASCYTDSDGYFSVRHSLQCGFIVGGEFSYGTEGYTLNKKYVRNCYVRDTSTVSHRCNSYNYAYYDSRQHTAEETSYTVLDSDGVTALWEHICLDTDFETSLAYVRKLVEWDADSQTAYFGSSPEKDSENQGYQVMEETDTSFLENVGALVGNYVLAETRARKDGLVAPGILLDMKPVETRTGTITAFGEGEISIDNNYYAVMDRLYPLFFSVGDFVMYHLYNGVIAGISMYQEDSEEPVYEMAITPEEEPLMIQVGKTLKLKCRLYRDDVRVLDWEQPEASVYHGDAASPVSLVGWEAMADASYELTLLGETLGNTYLVIDESTGGTSKMILIEVTQAEEELFIKPIYHADQLLEDEVVNFDELIGQINQYSPAAYVLNNAGVDDWAGAWDDWTLLYDTLTKGDEAVKREFEQREVYEAILLTALECATREQSAAAWGLSNAEKAVSVTNELLSWTGEILQLKHNLDLATDTKITSMSEKTKDALKDSFEEALEKGGFAEALNSLKEAGDFLGEIMKISTTAGDLVEKTMTYIELWYVSDSMARVLDEMLKRIPDTSEFNHMREATQFCSDMIRETSREQFLNYALMHADVLVGGEYALTEGTAYFWDKLREKVIAENPKLTFVLLGYKVGRTVTDHFIGVDNITEQLYKLRVVNQYISYLESAMLQIKKQYLDDRTEENANTLLHSVALLHAFAAEECDIAYQYADVADEMKIERILDAIGDFLDQIVGKPVEEEADVALKQYASATRDFFVHNNVDAATHWVYHLEEDYPEYYPDYAALIGDSRYDDALVVPLSSDYVVECPVDVRVYSESGELAADLCEPGMYSLGDVSAIQIGDRKVISIMDGASYSIVCEGYDQGMMKITAREYMGPQKVRDVVFRELEVTADSIYELKTRTDPENKTVYTVACEDSRIPADLDTGIEKCVEHVYGVPTFEWKADHSCDAWFICLSKDDVVTQACTITEETIPATQDEDGTSVYTAAVEFGGKTYTDTKTVMLPALNHKHRYEAVVREPTCTKRGYTTYICACGECYTGDRKEPLGHDFAEWIVLWEPTEEEKGVEERTCSRCGHAEQRSVPRLERPILPESYSNQFFQKTPSFYGKSRTSFVDELSDGGYQAVVYAENVLYIVNYNSDWEIVDNKTVDVELPRWGGFYSGDQYNYVVCGQSADSTQEEGGEVYRIIKYDKDFQRLDSISLSSYDTNTATPFKNGNVSIDESNGVLTIYTSCQRRSGSQTSFAIQINTSDMTVHDDAETNGMPGVYAVSSFRQIVKYDGDDAVYIDLMDGSTEHAVYLQHRDGLTLLVDLNDEAGDYDANAELSGLEISDTHFFVIGSRQVDYEQNIFLSIVNKATEEVETIWLTGVTPFESHTLYAPRIVKIGGDRYAVLWNDAGANAVRYLILDSQGNILGEEKEALDLQITDCEPIFSNGSIIWVTADDGIIRTACIEDLEETGTYEWKDPIIAADDPWDGTSDISWYDENQTEFSISTPEQLAGLSELAAGGNTFAGKTVHLVNDLFMNDSTYAHEWTAILNWEGTFNGNGHAIYNIYQDDEKGGLFDTVGETGIVKALTLAQGIFGTGGCVADVNEGIIAFCFNRSLVYSDSYSRRLMDGGICDENYNLVYGCRNYGRVMGDSVAGIVGMNKESVSVVSQCSNWGTVAGSNDASGIVGFDCGWIYNCYAKGTIMSTIPGNGNEANTISGIFSDRNSSGDVENCYSVCAFSYLSSTYCWGRYRIGPGTAINCYSGYSKSPEQMREQSFVELLNQQTNLVFPAWVEDADGINGGLPITIADQNYEKGIYKIQPELWIDFSEEVSLKPGESRKESCIPYYHEEEILVAIEDSSIAEASWANGVLTITALKEGETSLVIHFDETENGLAADYQITVLVDPYEGYCGDALKWHFDSETGVLSITGEGSMTNYSDFEGHEAPWYEYRKRITAIQLDDRITSIGSFTFRDCSEVSEIIIPNSVTSINRFAFEGCSGLREVTIPKNTASLGVGVFSDCTKLERVDVERENVNYASDEKGVVYNNEFTEIVIVPYAISGEYAIAEGVTTVDGYEFENRDYLTQVTFPTTLRKIGYSAFGSCGRLKYIIFTGDAPEIENYAFSYSRLTGYYPKDNETWPQEKRDAYCGGTITWKAMCASHEWNSWVLDREATCTRDGQERRDCTNCEYSEYRTIAAIGHSFGEWVLIQKPTEGEDGVEERTCTRCGHMEQRTIASLENPFTDVQHGSFYYEPVMWAVENGITNGTSMTTFGPNDQCMRAHVVTFLWRAVGSPEPTRTDNPFVDVKSGDFYYKPVLWALENGITSGMDATHFGPTAYCNRAQVVTFLYRTMGSPELESSENPFTDVAKGSFYEKPVLWAVQNGITNGLSATTFGPNAICNRAQIVTFLYRAFVND